MVTGNVIRDYARITFYWPQKIDMIATTSGKKLIVKFDRDVNPDFGAILRSLYPYVIKAELTGSQRTIIFTMKEAYAIRSFITDSESGVDILGIYEEPPALTPETATPTVTDSPAQLAIESPSAAQVTPETTPPAPAAIRENIDAPPPELLAATPTIPSTSPKPQPAPIQAPVVQAAPVIEAPSPKAKPRTRPVRTPQPDQTKAAPVINVQQNTVAPPAPPKKQPKPQVVAQAIQPAPEKPRQTLAQPQTLPTTSQPIAMAARNKTTAAPASAEKVVKTPLVEAKPTPVPTQAATTPAAPAKATPAVATTKSYAPTEKFGDIQGERLKIEHSIINKEPDLRFGFKERVAAASWQRGRTVMLWFDKPVTLTGLTDVKAKSTSWLDSIEQLGGDSYTLLKIDLNTDVSLNTLKDREGYGWHTRVMSTNAKPDNKITPNITKIRNQAAVFLPATQTPEPKKIYDPIIGDMLYIVPLYASNTGVYPPRSFVDFDLLHTTQGIVISSKSDRLSVARKDDGVMITAQGGLFITPNITEQDTEKAAMRDVRDQLFKDSLFPYREWKEEGNRSLHDRETFLLNQITTASDEKTRNQTRLKLAQLYIAHQQYNEATAVLKRIRRDDLDFYRDYKLAALEGVAYMLNYRLQEAALSFSSDTLDNTEEGELLRKAIAANMGNGQENVPYMEYNAAYIRQYPPALRQRLAIVTANDAIRKKDYRVANDVFETLEADRLNGEVADYINFLKAKVAAAAGRVDEAERIWGKLAKKQDDRQFRARAEYSLILLGLEEGTIPVEDAIKRLDALRIVWRGDDLERSLLMILGQLYVNQGNFWDGMKAWEELLQYYPNSPDALTAYQRLAETFRMLYLNGGADRISPIRALALYSEFQELTPLGDAGNEMIENLVDRLVNVDLLDEAAARLENQVKYRLEKEEKSRVGARLAYIYLLNRQPEKALSALQNSRVEDVPASLSRERNRFAAQALIDMDRADQALTMIEGDYTPDGEKVRLEAYWEKEDWAYIIDIIELMLRDRNDLNAPFTEQEGRELLKLALAYVFVGEFDQLKYLRDAYTPLMEGNPYREEFLFLTEERVQTSNDNFAEVIDTISSMEGFMNSYRNRVQQDGLSQAVGNADADTNDVQPPANPQ